ncbi:ribonuclease T2 [Edaphobacter bradus]|uniref:ribonuclease T2 n=1 Tax=Edaphobacter bradus TaxID=2259016 RepID=UPI0021E01C37|nr:ribonuclease T2 [Edaphobacter bradus]
MKKRTLPILLGLLLPIAACNSAPQPSSERATPAIQHRTATTNAPLPTAPQNFDYYLLNLSWSPEFCYSHRTAPECAQHLTFVLHGLWPQNTDGTYPQHCSDAPGPSDPSQFADIYPDPGLLRHEWQTHGTCSGLSADAFFTTARNAVQSVAIPPTLTQLTQQISLPPSQILGLFTASNPGIPASSLVLSCGNNYLTAIEVCMDKQLHPTACGPLRSCRANTVRIPPP